MLRIGTRGSRLAMAQTESIRLLLKQQVEIVTITTTGDSSAEPVLTGLGDGIFVKEIQTALRDGRIDLAVHSLKDMPTDQLPDLTIAAIPTRADPRDALVGATLSSLDVGATVGTSSQRRAAQLKHLRHDLKVAPIKGNVPTRIEKVRRGEYDAVLVAAAGLARLGLMADEILDLDAMLPAPGQGALALETRAGEQRQVAHLDNPATRSDVEMERDLLRLLGGGCLLPLGAFALKGTLIGAVTSIDGTTQIRAEATGGDAAAEVAEQLRRQGAHELLAQFAR
ncbi:MAG: hydroxymethylbilane synthase [Actinomycetota bacterium]